MKIKSMKRVSLEEAIPVYDIEVPETNNFALESGVIVHNSKDTADGVCGALWSCQDYYATKHPSQPLQRQRVQRTMEGIRMLNEERRKQMQRDDSYDWLFKD